MTKEIHELFGGAVRRRLEEQTRHWLYDEPKHAPSDGADFERRTLWLLHGARLRNAIAQSEACEHDETLGLHENLRRHIPRTLCGEDEIAMEALASQVVAHCDDASHDKAIALFSGSLSEMGFHQRNDRRIFERDDHQALSS